MKQNYPSHNITVTYKAKAFGFRYLNCERDVPLTLEQNEFFMKLDVMTNGELQVVTSHLYDLDGNYVWSCSASFFEAQFKIKNEVNFKDMPKLGKAA